MARLFHHRTGDASGPSAGCACCAPVLSRRRFVAGLAAAALGCVAVSSAEKASANEGLVEPRLTLKTLQDGRRTVALTLDACPGGFDAKIITALIEWRVPATLFVTGSWMHSNPTGLAMILAHPVLGERRIFGLRVAGDMDAIREEVDRGEEAIRAATGAKPIWYRGATALYSPSAVPAIEGMGFSIAGYSLNADMGASLPAEIVASRMRQAKDGDVIIAHTNQPNRPSGAGVIAGVRALLDQDVRFVRLDALTQSIASV